MATPDTPQPANDLPAASEVHPHAELIEDEVERVRVRRAPKYAVFLVAGAALGLLVALILTFTFDGTSAESPTTGFIYTPGQVFGFVSLIAIPAGVALGGIVALIFDRVLSRRAHDVAVDHERIQTVD